MQNLKPLLDDLELRINIDSEEQLFSDWKDFWLGKNKGDFFAPRRKIVNQSRIEWPDVNINDAFVAQELMLLREICSCNQILSSPVGKIMNIRANYGTGIMPSLFGGELFMMERFHNTLPTTIPQGEHVIDRLLQQGIPNLNAGLGQQVFDTTEYYLETLRDYPKISRFVPLYHPDLQGPLDILELVWGSDFFLALFDYPEKIHAMMRLINDTYIKFMEKYLALVPPTESGFSAHWGLLIRGQIALRNDSAINISAEQYEEFVRPYDQEILDKFNGGIIHYCGKGDHFVASMCKMEKLYAIHLSQPHLNDMPRVFTGSIDQGKRIVWLDEKTVEAANRPLLGLVNKGQGNL
jgi:hypothetical protein